MTTPKRVFKAVRALGLRRDRTAGQPKSSSLRAPSSASPPAEFREVLSPSALRPSSPFLVIDAEPRNPTFVQEPACDAEEPSRTHKHGRGRKIAEIADLS